MEGTKLLSEDFIQVAAQIAALNEKKKELKVELKAYHEKIKSEIADLEKEAACLYNAFTVESSK